MYLCVLLSLWSLSTWCTQGSLAPKCCVSVGMFCCRFIEHCPSQDIQKASTCVRGRWSVMLCQNQMLKSLLRYHCSYWLACQPGGYVHAGWEVLQPAIARQAEQRHLSLGDCTQLLFLAAAAAACLAEASTALHVSRLCLVVCSCWVLVCLSACVW